MLEDLGIDPERVTLEWVSGAEGPKFAQTVTQFTDKIKELGPNTFRTEMEQKEQREVEACQ